MLHFSSYNFSSLNAFSNRFPTVKTRKVNNYTDEMRQGFHLQIWTYNTLMLPFQGKQLGIEIWRRNFHHCNGLQIIRISKYVSIECLILKNANERRRKVENILVNILVVFTYFSSLHWDSANTTSNTEMVVVCSLPKTFLTRMWILGAILQDFFLYLSSFIASY